MTKKKATPEAQLKEAGTVEGLLTTEWLVGSFDNLKNVEFLMHLICKIECIDYIRVQEYEVKNGQWVFSDGIFWTLSGVFKWHFLTKIL